jgi:transcriptional regulator with XRE-family HTH domain
MTNEIDEIAQQLPTALHRILDERRIKTQDLAAGTGLTRQAISRILNGRTRSPHRATIEKLATFLQIPAGRLLRCDLPGGTPEFLQPDQEIISQIPDKIGPELEAMIEAELPDRAPLRLEGPSSEARQDILKMKLYLILKKRRLAAGEVPSSP